MRQFPRRKLCEIVARYGASLCDDPIRCEGLLSDLCGQYKREVFILVCALKQKVPVDMLSFSGNVPIELIILQLANRLQADLSVNKSAARWGIESWALALGLISVSDLKKQSPKNRTVPPKTFHNSLDDDLHETSNANGISINKPDIGHDNLNLKARTDKEKLFRRVGLMALMMYVGLLIGWLLSRIY